MKEKSGLRMRYNPLYGARCLDDGDSLETQHQLMISTSACRCILEHAQDTVGYMGQERTMTLLCSRCFWPGVATDVKDHITDCACDVRTQWLYYRMFHNSSNGTSLYGLSDLRKVQGLF